MMSVELLPLSAFLNGGLTNQIEFEVPIVWKLISQVKFVLVKPIHHWSKTAKLRLRAKEGVKRHQISFYLFSCFSVS